MLVNAPLFPSIQLPLPTPCLHLTGLPMKLVFFVHPSDMLKSPSRYNSLPSDRDYIQHVDGPDLGVSASLSLQASEKVYPLSVDPNLFE